MKCWYRLSDSNDWIKGYIYNGHHERNQIRFGADDGKGNDVHMIEIKDPDFSFVDTVLVITGYRENKERDFTYELTTVCVMFTKPKGVK